MYSKKTEKVKIIHANSAEEFEESLNRYLSQLAEAKVKYNLSFNNSLGFCAYLIYTEVVDIPESISEEYELRGERRYCTECICCRIPDDRRIKNYQCSHTHSRVSKYSPCCDYFYEMLERGETLEREEV